MEHLSKLQFRLGVLAPYARHHARPGWAIDNVIVVPCPQILSPDIIAEVAARRAKAAPSVTPPRVTVGNDAIHIEGNKRALETPLWEAKKRTQQWCPALTEDGAAYRTRTCDPRITNAMLYQLS